MKKVKIKKQILIAGKPIKEGEVVELHDTQAAELIGRGAAVKVGSAKDEPKPVSTASVASKKKKT